MGLFDYYGDNGCQIKVGECDMAHYKLGDSINIPDGVYVCHEGLIVVHNGIFVCELNNLYTKWGDKLDNHVLLRSVKEEPFTNGV